MLAELEPAAILAIVLASGAFFGCLLLWLLRRQDHHTWVLARAPGLPIRTLSVGDDAWLRGRVLADQPLVCPWFDRECVAYHYSIERKVTTTHRDSKGRTRRTTSWRTEHSENDAIDFHIDDGEKILVRIKSADNEALVSIGTDYEGPSRRHSARVLEPGAIVSVLGVKTDDGSFAAVAEVPLLITRKERQARVRSSHRSETALFVFAWLLPFAAGAIAMILSREWQWYQEPLQILLVLLGGTGMAAPFWWLGTYNRLVRLRQQVLASFRQVDVDLAVRAALVPNLVSVVKASATHEQQLLEDLAAIRAGTSQDAAVAGEQRSVAAARQTLLLHERHPELRADAVYRDLHERLWTVEEKLAHSRSLYNDIVQEWNDRIARFPALLVARVCGYRQAPSFQGDDAEVPPPLRDIDMASP